MKKYTKILTSFIFILFTVSLLAQESETNYDEGIIQTFRHTRIINSHSVETLPAHKLDFRVVHRFGDFGGDSGGWSTLYGLENASDISIGFEYGLSNKVMIGVNRSKGAGPLKQNLNGLVKFRLMNQNVSGQLPISLSVLGMTSYSTMQKSELEGALNFFEKGSHRLTYHFGLYMARKFSERLSVQFNAGMTFRNVVPAGDQNELASLGGAVRIQVSKAFGLVFDANFPVLSDLRTSENGYYPSLGVGFELDTSGGHVFQINLTNSTGISETDFIPYTRTNWSDGEFRLGFTISRLFSL